MAATTIPSATAGSAVIQAHLVSEQGRITGDIWAYSIAKLPWPNLLKRGEFKKGAGARQRSVRFNRSLAGTTGRITFAPHSALGFSSASAGNSPPDVAVGSRSLPPVTVIQASQQVDEYGLQWGEWQTPLFDVRDAVFNYDFIDQFAKYYEQCKMAAARAWEYEMRLAYFAKCSKKILPAVPASATPTDPYCDLTVVAPTTFAGMVQYSLAQLKSSSVANGFSDTHSVLTNGILQDIRAKLDRKGISVPGGNYPLVCSPDQIWYLCHEPNMRADLRYANEGTLLKGLGANYTKTFLGFNFIPDPEVPRFTLALSGSLYDFTEYSAWTYQAGQLSTTFSAAATSDSGAATRLTLASVSGIVANNVVRLAPTSASSDTYSGEYTVISVDTASNYIYINKAFTATATGTVTLLGNGESGFVENPSYDTAPYEGSFIVFQDVVEIQTLDYPSTLGNGSQFDTRKGLGTAEWVNYRNPDWNPHGTMGYYSGIYEYAAKPMRTEDGYFILHRRAPAITLASPSFANTVGLGLL